MLLGAPTWLHLLCALTQTHEINIEFIVLLLKDSKQLFNIYWTFFSYLCTLVQPLCLNRILQTLMAAGFLLLLVKAIHCMCVCVNVHSNEGVISLPRVLRALPCHHLIPIFLPVVPFIPLSSLIQILVIPPCLLTHFHTSHTFTSIWIITLVRPFLLQSFPSPLRLRITVNYFYHCQLVLSVSPFVSTILYLDLTK